MAKHHLNKAQQSQKKPCTGTILRAVASSSAIESQLSVEAIEKKLKETNGRFSHLQLAL